MAATSPSPRVPTVAAIKLNRGDSPDFPIAIGRFPNGLNGAANQPWWGWPPPDPYEELAWGWWSGDYWGVVTPGTPTANQVF
jgi:hypothetical protein